MVLLAEGGRDALTTRAVADAARVQPPVLYRLFQDKAGLLDAVAEYGFNLYMGKKQTPPATADPTEALRAGWRTHVAFGLAHPALYLIMYANPRPGKQSSAAGKVYGMLLAYMRHLAVAGQLRIPEERAASLCHAAACGLVLTLLSTPEAQRDMSLSDRACDAVLAAILTESPKTGDPTLATAATTVRALLAQFPAGHGPEPGHFTAAERTLLQEWLLRLAEG